MKVVHVIVVDDARGCSRVQDGVGDLETVLAMVLQFIVLDLEIQHVAALVAKLHRVTFKPYLIR